MTSMGSENAAYGLSQYYEDELIVMQQRRDGVGGPLSALGLFSGSLYHAGV